MKEGMWNKNISMEEIHERILKSIMTSSEFDNELQKTLVASMLDLFINANNGLNFFFNYYELTTMDLYLYYKEPIYELFGEEVYNQIENKVRKD
jgi:hypothetical protein